MPDPDGSWKLESAPPSTVIREALKLLDGAERVNVRVAVSPAFSDVTSELMAIVGLVLSVVSTERVTVLLLSEPSSLEYPVGKRICLMQRRSHRWWCYLLLA